jgi:hypothetical protein
VAASCAEKRRRYPSDGKTDTQTQIARKSMRERVSALLIRQLPGVVSLLSLHDTNDLPYFAPTGKHGSSPSYRALPRAVTFRVRGCFCIIPRGLSPYLEI